MKFDIKFATIAQCRRFPKDAPESNLEEVIDVDIDLIVDKNTASNFIFRFAPSVFKIPDTNYQCVLKFDASSNLIGICFIDDEYIYVVKNMNLVLGDLVEGFIRTRLLEKNSAMMEFDFETASEKDNNEEVVDEFDLKQN